MNVSLLSSHHHHLVLLPLIPYPSSLVPCHLALNAADIMSPLCLSLTYHGQMHAKHASKIDSHASPHQQGSHSHGLKTQSGWTSAQNFFPKPSHPVTRSSHGVFCLRHLLIFKAKQNCRLVARTQVLHVMVGQVKFSTITLHSRSWLEERYTCYGTLSTAQWDIWL